MSTRENIASNIASTISGITSPSIKKVTRQPFDLDELSDKQYPAVIVQTSEETREDIEMGDGAKRRQGTIDFIISGFVKGAESNIDTLRNQVIEVVEETLDNDITRNGNALDTQIVEANSDEGVIFPYGAVRITARVLYEFTRGNS